MPHGGPYDVRDLLGYDPEVQFLANRGYAVLQPNYRGSSGYGTEFAAKGEGQWGRAMQDDLDDGVDWLVQRGLVDPRRVCIVRQFLRWLRRAVGRHAQSGKVPLRRELRRRDRRRAAAASTFRTS